MLDAEEQSPPTLDTSNFDRLETLLAGSGPLAAVEELCRSLRELGDFNALFYALLMKKRVELGVPPFPTGAGDLPPETHEPYEQAIRESGRLAGQLYLERDDIRRAWFFFNMLGELEPIRDYIGRYEITADKDPQAVIEVALYNGAHPAKGFALVLERYGICNSITTFSQYDFSRHPDAKQECIKLLVRALHLQLVERLASEIVGRGDTFPETKNIISLMMGRKYLFADDAYHIDTSHLASIVQMSLELTDGEEVKLARELCAYGEKLSLHFQQEADPPFEKTYADYKVLLEVTAGIEVEKGLQHFRDKIEPAAEQGNLFPAEVYVNLLLRINRKPEAVEAAKKYLSAESRPMSCPGVYELCREANDFAGLAEAARKRADGVNFLAAKIAGGS
jgi:hypothetical protein